MSVVYDRKEVDDGTGVLTYENVGGIKTVLDEIFDSSLDQQGTDDFFKIVNKLRNENIFIISHKGDILFDKFTNILKFEKYQNFTRLQNT